LVDIGGQAGEHSAAFSRCPTVCVNITFPAGVANKVKDHVDAVLIHKGIMRYVINGKFVGWAGGMPAL